MNPSFFQTYSETKINFMSNRAISRRDKVVLLWDIDGTLLDTGGAGVAPFNLALEKYLGRKAPLNRAKIAGLTDYQIVESVLQENQTKMPNAFVESMILNAYTSGLKRALEANPVKVLGSIKLSLANLGKSDFFELGILTGNCKSGTKVKLESAGMNGLFAKTNIFNSSNKLRSREQILKKALSEIPHKVIVIGDTPADIHAARSLSTPILSISTGFFDSRELSALNPNNVLNEGWSYSDLLLKLNAL